MRSSKCIYQLGNKLAMNICKGHHIKKTVMAAAVSSQQGNLIQ